MRWNEKIACNWTVCLGVKPRTPAALCNSVASFLLDARFPICKIEITLLNLVTKRTI